MTERRRSFCGCTARQEVFRRSRSKSIRGTNIPTERSPLLDQITNQALVPLTYYQSMHTRSKTDRDRRLADRNFKKTLLAKNRPQRSSIKSTTTNRSTKKQQPVLQHQTSKRHSKIVSNRSPVARFIALRENMSSDSTGASSSSSGKEVEGVPPTPASSPTKGVAVSALFQGAFTFGSSTMQFNVGFS